MKILFLVALFGLMSCSHAGNYSVSDHFDGSRFFNPNGPGTKSLWKLLEWKMNSKSVPWPTSVENKKYEFKKIQNEKVVITFINHATFLIQLPDLTILTDPIFAQRAGPFQSFGPVKRVRSAGIRFEDLPKIDVVLISHNHYDHLSLEDLKKISQRDQSRIFAPLGDKILLESEGIKNVEELDWWSEVSIGKNSITFTPVQHWSARGVFDKNKSLWGGYYIKSLEKNIYFAGDTGYTRFFKITKERLGAPDISLLPIGAYEPRWFMKDFHMDPVEAVQAHKDLESKLSLGMHFGTFKLSDEGYHDPLRSLQKLDINNFRTLDFGESLLIQ